MGNEKDGKCATCEHWKPRESGEMAKHHMAICAFGKTWTFLSPHEWCARHVQAAPAIVAARAKWLAKVMRNDAPR